METDVIRNSISQVLRARFGTEPGILGNTANVVAEVWPEGLMVDLCYLMDYGCFWAEVRSRTSFDSRAGYGKGNNPLIALVRAIRDARNAGISIPNCQRRET